MIALYSRIAATVITVSIITYLLLASFVFPTHLEHESHSFKRDAIPIRQHVPKNEILEQITLVERAGENNTSSIIPSQQFSQSLPSQFSDFSFISGPNSPFSTPSSSTESSTTPPTPSSTPSFSSSVSSTSSSSSSVSSSSSIIHFSSSTSSTIPTTLSTQETTSSSTSAEPPSSSSETFPLSTSSPPSSTEAPSSSKTTAAPSSSTFESVTVFNSVDNGSTFFVTRTQTITSAGPSASTNNKNSDNSGGLSSTNKIIVGVVVGVGGAIILAIGAFFFWYKKKSDRDHDNSGWTFWRKNEKGGNDDYLSGELGVRDRNINAGSNF